MSTTRRVSKLVDGSAGSEGFGKKIKEVGFGLLSPEEMSRVAEVECCNRELYQMPSRNPARYGCLDMRLGAANKATTCETCRKRMDQCAGHFGVVQLVLPVFHAGYLKHVLTLLQCLCKTCSRALVKPTERESLLRRMRSPAADALRKASLFKRVVERCKVVSTCPYCGSANGPVKKISNQGVVKLAHDKFKAWKGGLDDDGECPHHEKLRAMQYLNPLDVRRLFERASDDDCELLWSSPAQSRPEHLVVSSLLVPPTSIRPSVAVDTPGGGGSNEDDLTVKLQEIIDVNAALRQAVTKGGSTKMVLDTWAFLQMQVGQFINGEGKKPIRGLCQRLKGKTGRFRGNLSGKRVDFSGRTVISPDPNLSIDEVGTPRHVASTMTFPERVNALNIDKVRQLVLNGPKIYPGANYVETASMKRSLQYGDRRKVAKELKIGDIVERHLLNGDLVLFNRQPSLHKLSIMAHRVRVKEARTFSFNECVCAPYNADFDGDEMNMHVPQTHEARAEADELMRVAANVCTPRNGEPLVAATQDFITASFLMTTKDTFYHREQYCALATYFDSRDSIKVPKPAILKPRRLWTGKQLFSLLVSTETLSFELKERNYSSGLDACPNDGYVVFRRSMLLAGNIAKKTIGDGSKRGLIYSLFRDHGPAAAARCMNRLARMAARYLGYHYGFSIGISDVAPTRAVQTLKEGLLKSGSEEAEALIATFRDDRLPLKPGCDALQSLESELAGLLGSVREKAGKNLMSHLRANAASVMATCGSKGSAINISQMIACLGQQAVDGKRIANGFVKRTLPHFPVDALGPQARGFVGNSFYSGLTATEFFFHTMGGREGLVDTAVKTAQTGYMARRLMKALEDLSLHYDGTVRNSESAIVQLVYGDDGLDPSCMEANDRPVDMDRLLYRVQAGDYPNQRTATATATAPEEIRDYLKKKEEERRKAPLEHLDNIPSVAEHASTFARIATDKVSRSRVQPGEAVGAIGAQCISEPGTQMTLKTFHFAGVASMNVTLGVPRLTEIINAAKSISTPIITATLDNPKSEVSARLVKARIERTTLGEIATLHQVYAPDSVYILAQIDARLVAELHLVQITSRSVRAAILRSKLKLRAEHVLLNPDHAHALRIVPPDPSFFGMQTLKAALPDVVVDGVPSVNRAVLNKNDDNNNVVYNLLVEGYGLEDVMAADGINGRETTTNHVAEVESTLGIEAARSTISNEISYIMSAYGIGIDQRHLSLLSDVMTFKGMVLGITRFGISKMRESVLMLASFERTTDHLFDAAVHSRTDSIVGVSECIIMGIPIPLGSGAFKLLNDDDGKRGDDDKKHPHQKRNNGHPTIPTTRRRLIMNHDAAADAAKAAAAASSSS
ncbi:hypothetical protein CTAYLR_004114 [Chrysophaeum taylorii]|uniref:DNA-directed RNA polymerase subunit n=1 Tax=Chrysophaeum taylorii TaxID=2483200 RepID=A0AAD7XID6_9STRA|nr:hypothetical protein CTAYLR_004114 [Chrysophaeum taylorii]